MEVLRRKYHCIDSIGHFLQNELGIHLSRSEKKQFPSNFLNDFLIAWNPNILGEWPKILDPVSKEYAEQNVDIIISHVSSSKKNTEYICKLDVPETNAWVKVCQNFGPKLFSFIINRSQALFRRIGKSLFQILGYPCFEDKKKQFTKLKRKLVVEKPIIATTSAEIIESENFQPPFKQRKRNRKKLSEEALNYEHDKIDWPRNMVSKNTSLIYPIKFMYSADLRERWPTNCALGSAWTNMVDRVAIEIFGQGLAQAPKMCLYKSIGELVKRRKKCCLPALLNCYIPMSSEESELGLEKLAQTWISQNIVHTFCKSLFRRITPPSLLGPENTVLFTERCAGRLCDMQRKDCMALHELKHKLKVTDCAWLNEIRNSKMQSQAFDCVLMWLLRLYALLMRSCFYITESQMYRNRLLYYRKPVWLRIQRLGSLEFMEKCGLKKMSAKKMKIWRNELTKSTFGPFSLRFVPKKDGVRPIIVTPQATKENRVAVMNWKLEPIKAILWSIISKRPELLGSAFGKQDFVHRKWKEFALKCRELAQTPYMVKIDVTRCFDHIIQNKLLDILNEIFNTESPSGFVIHKYRSLCVRDAIVRKRSRFMATPFEKTKFGILDTVEQSVRAPCVMVPNAKGEPQLLTRRDLITNLKVLIKHHSLVIRGKHFVQTRGIPQGSCISVIMCNLYLGFMERLMWPQLMPSQSMNCILLRHVDDFLLATLDLDAAQYFVSSLLNGIEKFDMHAKPEKTVLNFQGESLTQWSELLKVLKPNESLPWCGMMFCPENQNVSLDVSRLVDASARDMVSFRFHNCRGEWFRRTLKFGLSARAMRLTLDRSLNGPKEVLKTTNYLRELARKCAHVLHANMYCSGHCNTEFIHKVETELQTVLSGLVAKNG